MSREETGPTGCTHFPPLHRPRTSQLLFNASPPFFVRFTRHFHSLALRLSRRRRPRDTRYGLPFAALCFPPEPLLHSDSRAAPSIWLSSIALSTESDGAHSTVYLGFPSANLLSPLDPFHELPPPVVSTFWPLVFFRLFIFLKFFFAFSEFFFLGVDPHILPKFSRRRPSSLSKSVNLRDSVHRRRLTFKVELHWLPFLFSMAAPILSWRNIFRSFTHSLSSRPLDVFS